MKAGETLLVELLGSEAGKTIVFDKVLLKAGDGSVEIGRPYLKGVTVEARVLGEKRGSREIVFRYHSKTRYRKKKTHRQTRTAVSVEKI